MNKAISRSLLQATFYRQFSYKSVRRPAFTSNPNVATTSNIQPKTNTNETPVDLTKNIRAKIYTTGPITVAEYMRQVLTNPQGGYYMNRDVFGQEGDFITSPEISQIFGELVGVWALSEWRKLGSPIPFQLIELGPGRGTLSRDVLKVLAQFKLGGHFSMHLVEISPHLSKMQAHSLCFSHEEVNDEKMPFYQTGKTASGTEVFWYKHLEDVPEEFSIVLAHEFFDALPVHKLQLDKGVWKEILIDVNDVASGGVDDANAADFRFVLSKSQTPISHLYKPIDGDVRECLEYSLEVDRFIRMLSERLERDGGIGLIMDYGHFGEKTDTFRAFKKHKLHDPLKEPGSADLTADVDFRQIKQIAEEKGQILCYGPIEQGVFLKKMEGDARLEQLLNSALPENQVIIRKGYEMLTDPKQMGKRFKFFSMFPATLKEHHQKYPVIGFN